MCLKEKLGTNKYAMKFMDCAEFGVIFQIRLKLTTCKVVAKLLRIPIIRDILLLLKSVAVYYADLIKDIFFVLFIKDTPHAEQRHLLKFAVPIS